MLGFEMESSGWENINYRSYLLGETPRSIAPKRQEIADFTELGEFLDMPVRHYSAGMLVRLAFAISTALRPTHDMSRSVHRCRRRGKGPGAFVGNP